MRFQDQRVADTRYIFQLKVSGDHGRSVEDRHTPHNQTRPQTVRLRRPDGIVQFLRPFREHRDGGSKKGQRKKGQEPIIDSRCFVSFDRVSFPVF